MITILSPYLGQVRLIRQKLRDAVKEYPELFDLKGEESVATPPNSQKSLPALESSELQASAGQSDPAIKVRNIFFN